jgi:hypothetical protein
MARLKNDHLQNRITDAWRDALLIVVTENAVITPIAEAQTKPTIEEPVDGRLVVEQPASLTRDH